ncbi:MAG: V-type ATPase subunit [Syntrophorhabdaceae bacterium]
MTTLTTSMLAPAIKNRPEWGFVCGRISALEGKLLHKDFFPSIIEMHHTEDIFQHLQGTLIEDYLDPGIPWEDFSAVADRCFYDLASSIREDSPSPVPANLFLIKNDYLNIKNALAGLEGVPFLPGIIPENTVYSILDGDFGDLPSPFRERMTGAAIDIDELDESVSDIFVDGAYLRHMLDLAASIDSPLIQVCVRELVVGHAVSALWRILRQDRDLKTIVDYMLPIGDESYLMLEVADIPDAAAWPDAIGGEIGDLFSRALQMPFDEQVSTFELKMINLVLKMSTYARFETSGPERVFDFLMALEAEMQNLKLVVTGKLNRIDADILAQRLRYVNV